jgi:hypothetical protein
MIKFKHTPGPWGYDKTHEKSLNYWYVITHNDGYGPIVDVGGTDLNGQIAEAKHLITDKKEIEANARLIAAAPEMLDWILKRITLENERIENLYNRDKLNQIIAKIEINEKEGLNLIEKATGLPIEEVLNDD